MNDDRKPFGLIHGGRDIVEQLEDALERAKSGELVGVVICGITEAGCGWTGAYNTGIAYPWPRLLAAVDTAQQELVADGIADWS